MAIDFSKKVQLPNGVTVLNCTPHQITFRLTTGEDIVVGPCGATLKATTEEVNTYSPYKKVRVVTVVFLSSPEGEEELAAIQGVAKATPGGLLPVGSIISAQAYAGQVYGMTPADGFERVPVDEKRMNPDKFTVFPPR